MSQSDNTPLLSSRQGVSLLLPFLAVTTCFAMWGFANDITAPLVKAFSKIFRMSVTEGALVQVAFYLTAISAWPFLVGHVHTALHLQWPV